MMTWRKHEANPVIPHPPPEPVDPAERDQPLVWKEGDAWYMALGCGFLGTGGALLLYRSPDLIKWEYLHPLCVGTEPEFNRWLVPDFFPLGDRHVLLTAATTRGESGKAI